MYHSETHMGDEDWHLSNSDGMTGKTGKTRRWRLLHMADRAAFIIYYFVCIVLHYDKPSGREEDHVYLSQRPLERRFMVQTTD